MHYRDGTEAKVGDIVRGKGYNIKNAAGELADFVGLVADVLPGSASCNVRVVYLRTLPTLDKLPDYRLFQASPGMVMVHKTDGTYQPVRADIEYGQADHFELMFRPEA